MNINFTGYGLAAFVAASAFHPLGGLMALAAIALVVLGAWLAKPAAKKPKRARPGTVQQRGRAVAGQRAARERLEQDDRRQLPLLGLERDRERPAKHVVR